MGQHLEKVVVVFIYFSLSTNKNIPAVRACATRVSANGSSRTRGVGLCRSACRPAGSKQRGEQGRQERWLLPLTDCGLQFAFLAALPLSLQQLQPGSGGSGGAEQILTCIVWPCGACMD